MEHPGAALVAWWVSAVVFWGTFFVGARLFGLKDHPDAGVSVPRGSVGQMVMMVVAAVVGVVTATLVFFGLAR